MSFGGGRVGWRVLCLLPEAALRLALARLALWVLAYGRVIRLWGLRPLVAPAPQQVAAPPQEVGLAIDIAARRLVPCSNCLCRALAAHGMLRRRGWSSQLGVGLMKADDRLYSHAWLCCGAHWISGRRGHGNARFAVWFS